MKKTSKSKLKVLSKSTAMMTLGEYAHQTIDEQFRQMIKQEKQVLADKDPEHLHQMRVSTRRLYTALQVFDAVIELPKTACARRVRSLTKVLGNLRDLDVQIAILQTDYQPELEQHEQDSIEQVLAVLEHKRRKALAGTQDALGRSRYQDLKLAYTIWLNTPHFTPLAQLPVVTALPDLLSPLLSTLLLHPAWLIATENLSDDTMPILHDLRKACKYVRYQADFFVLFYGDTFKSWVAGMRSLQDSLGKLQDIQVLRELLAETLPKGTELVGLNQAIQQRQQHVLGTWNTVRNQYLERSFRYQMHDMLLNPTGEECASDAG